MSDHEPHNWENQEPEELKMALHNIRTQPVPTESLARSLAAAERIPMTVPAWRRGALNMLLVGVPLYAGIAGVAYWFSTRLDLPNEILFMLACLAFMVPSLSFMIVRHFLQRSRVGAVLIDCGPPPGRFWFLLQIPVWTGMGIMFLADGLRPETVIWTSLFLCFVPFMIYLATGRLQVCEGGIRLHHQLLPWNDIKSYSWKEGDTPTLLIQTTSRFTWYSHGAYPIPAKHRDALEELLRDKLKAQTANQPRE